MEPFGERLKREREKRGVTLDDISAGTKIGTRMLRALEEEKFDQLPGGIFNKGFVRAYAQQLGIDEDQAVADYLATIGENQPEKKPESFPQSFPIEVREERRSSDAVAEIPWGWLAVALLVLALGFSFWSLHSRHSLSETKPASSTTPSAAATGQASNSPVVSGANPATPAGSFTVLVKARDDSWISITADEKEIMHDTLVAPGEKSATAQKEIVIKVGSVGALQFSFNGQVLPVQGDLGEVKTLTFSPSGLQPSVPPPPQPSPVPPR